MMPKQSRYLVVIVLVYNKMANGCDSVGKAVASDTKGLQSNLVICKIFYRTCLLLPVEKTRSKKKKPGMGHF